MRYTDSSMYKQKTAYFLVVAVVFVASSIISSTVVLGQTNNALVTKTPEQSNLIIDCSFGESGKEDCSIKHFFQLANNVMKLLLWVAITGAGLLIFYKGTKLAVNVFTKGGHQQARKEVQDALRATLVGLLFILSAYLIVKAGFDIIGYNLNDGDPFKYDESSLPTPDIANLTEPSTPDPTESAKPTTPAPVTPTEPADTTPTTTSVTPLPQTETAQCVQEGGGTALCTCTNCTTPLGITFKNNTKVHKDLANKLIALKNKTTDIIWTVTEAWPTTVGHSGECHYAGTCVDIDFSSAHNGGYYSGEDIRIIIQKAKEVGLLAVYETRSKTTAEALTAGHGIPTNNVLQWPDITGDHFSVYDCNLPHPSRRC